MKMVRSLFLVLALSAVSPAYAWKFKIDSGVPGVTVLIKPDDCGFELKLPFSGGNIHHDVTVKGVYKDLTSLASGESKFLITQCLGNKLPTAYGWTDIAGSRLAGSIAVLSGNQALKKDLQEFYKLKKQLRIVKTLEEKKEILTQCVILKHRIREMLKEKKTVDKEASK